MTYLFVHSSYNYIMNPSIIKQNFTQVQNTSEPQACSNYMRRQYCFEIALIFPVNRLLVLWEAVMHIICVLLNHTGARLHFVFSHSTKKLRLYSCTWGLWKPILPSSQRSSHSPSAMTRSACGSSMLVMFAWARLEGKCKEQGVRVRNEWRQEHLWLETVLRMCINT